MSSTTTTIKKMATTMMIPVLTKKMKREKDNRELGLRRRRRRRCDEINTEHHRHHHHHHLNSHNDHHHSECFLLILLASNNHHHHHPHPHPHPNSRCYRHNVLIILAWLSMLVIMLQASNSSNLMVEATVVQNRPNLPPRFKSDGSDFDSQSEIVVRVKEGPSSLNKEIYHLHGEDPDNDPLTFGVLGTLGKDLLRIESISPNEAKIFLRKELDREIQDSYTLVLTLSDGKLGKGNYITKSLLLIVEDINDNAPIFRPFRTAVMVRENAKPGTLIETFEAFDSDEGRFGQVFYQLGDESHDTNSLGSNMFSIQTIDGKGILRLSGQLDYERKSLYQIRVLAIDRATEDSRKTSTAAIVVQVEDVDDQPPIFTSIPSVTRIPEDMPIGGAVLQITAIDGDKGVNNPITYRIIKGGNGLFTINSNTGVVSVAGKLDREAPANTITIDDNNDELSPNNFISSSALSASYILEIEAIEVTHVVFPPPSVTTEVTIILTDVNDEIPRFRYRSYTAEILENSPPDMSVTFTGRSPKSQQIKHDGDDQWPLITALSPQVYDLDQGNNGTFTLHLEVDDEDNFRENFTKPDSDLRAKLVDTFYVTPLQSTNEATLSVRVRNPLVLDYEKLKHIKLRLIAKERTPSAGNTLRFSSADLTIFIKDANDNSPQFSQEIYYGSVSETPTPGTIVAQVSATDLDDGLYGTDGIRYTSLRGDVSAALELNPKTGVITVKNDSDWLKLFDREQHQQHFLIVEARDAAGFGNKNTVQLILNITDVNDMRPRFSHSSYTARIYENQHRFEQDFGVTAVDDDAPNTANSRLRYSIVLESSPFAKNFDIDANSGRISVAKPLDFEALPGPIADSRNISFRVGVHDHGTPPLDNEVLVNVIVFDQNDNAPIFSQTLYTKSIPEDVRDGSMVIQVMATDADQSPANSRVYYRLLSGGADKFVIDSSTGIISVAKGASLDPDKSITIGNTKMSKKLWYLLKVMAIDSSFGSEEQLSSIATVNVTIVDVNNKAPEFPNDLPEVYVPEDAKLNQYVTKITAFDLDEKPVLRYSFDYSRSEARNEFGIAVDLASFTESFSIGPVDGVVRVNSELDRELWSILKLQVVVEDIAAITKGQKARTTFTIHITDVNDNPPRFTQKLYRAIVPENSIPGTSVITVVAEDRDINKSVTYSLESDEFDLLRMLRVNSTTGEVSVLGRIDREVYNWLNLTVRAVDSGEPPLSGTAQIAVQVLDENDNNPVFDDENLHKVTIPEDAPIGSLVVQVTASDADIGAFGKLTYLLDSSSSLGKFRIDRETGSIIVADQLDREQMSTYKLLVQAWDNYEYGFSTGESRKAFKTLTIVISDINDETPRIIFPTADAECTFISEFHGINDPVVTIQAHDADDPTLPNGQVSFSIVNNNNNKRNNDGEVDDDYDVNEIFEFGPNGDTLNSIILRTKSSLRGRVGNFTILVQVMDGGQPPLSSISPVKVCVTDVNDHSPIFVKPPSNMTIRISENATIGTRVVDVLALDSDHGLNAEVRYRLRELPNGHWRSFQIHPVTGVITLAKELDRETTRVHELRVQAYDLGTPTSLSTDMDITVLVTNVDDFEPEFTQDVFHVVFTENLDPGTERYKLLPTIDKDDVFDLNDPDAAFKSIPCYFIVGGDGYTSQGEELFKLDTFTHELSATKPLDREQKANYTLIVQATNDCFRVPHRVERFDPKDNSMLKVLVDVRDVNDNPPRFVKKVFSGGITTDTEYGTVFMSVKAVDPDQGINSVTTYYIVSEVRKSFSEGLETVPSRPFEINHKTGEISLNFDPQKGMKGYFQFEVKANDTDGLYDIAKVFIYLLRADQRVRFVLRLTPQELRGKLDRFQDVLANITGALVNVDSYRFHETEDGAVDQKKTDLYLHFVDRDDNSIIEVNSVLLLIDKNIDYLDDLYKEFNVLISEPTTMAEPFMEWEDQLKAGLAGTSAFLFLLLILVIALCLNQKTRYERQLKAATIPIFGHEPQLTRSNVPNTNQHATEGSNPMWMTGYDNQWYKDEERLSESSSSTTSQSSNNSLDENALTNAGDEHLNFSSLDTLEHHHSSAEAVAERIAARSESSGNSSSSTTNDRSVLCRISNTISKPTPSQSAIGLGINNHSIRNGGGGSTFGTVGRRPVITASNQTANHNHVPAPPKKPMAPKPPQAPPNIVVISGGLGAVGGGGHPNVSQPKSPCVNNIYIETFSNHHKNNGPSAGGGGVGGGGQVLVNGPIKQNGHHEPSANGGHGHYHHYHHHHHPAQHHHYFGMTKGVAVVQEVSTASNTTAAAIPNGHYIPDSQLMNLETTEL